MWHLNRAHSLAKVQGIDFVQLFPVASNKTSSTAVSYVFIMK